jgi:hypothetical protein
MDIRETIPKKLYEITGDCYSLNFGAACARKCLPSIIGICDLEIQLYHSAFLATWPPSLQTALPARIHQARHTSNIFRWNCSGVWFKAGAA